MDTIVREKTVQGEHAAPVIEARGLSFAYAASPETFVRSTPSGSVTSPATATGIAVPRVVP